GFELAAGQRHAIDLPEMGVDEAFDRIWMFYRATYPGRPTLVRPGDTVCELRLWERGRGEARLIEFRHQESMFFEFELQNQEPPADGDTRTAFRWKDAEQEARVNFVRSFDLDAQIARIELRNVGPYPIRFRSIVFGREVRSVTLKPEGSPLRYDETGREFLDPAFLDELHDAHVAVFRGGRLTASTSKDLGNAAPLDFPADVRRVALDEPFFDRGRAGEGAATYRAFSLLGGDWGGAVLGVLLRDTGFEAHAQAVRQVGLVTVICAVPILLLLVGSALALLGNLRLRLIVAVGAVMLVPLGILSFVLIGVLEGAYQDDLRARLDQSVASARAALDGEQQALRTSSKAWVQDLAEQFSSAIASSDVDAAIRTTLASQRPPAWGDDGGFLLFEFRPDPARVDAPVARSVFLGPDDLRELDTPLRTDPGLYVAWSVVILGVRADAELPFGSCSLSVGRRLDTGFLDGVARDGGDVLLCGTNGYALDLDAEQRRRVDPAEVRERAVAGMEVQETGKPVVRHFERDGEPVVAIYDVLRDLQQTPRALLGILEPYEGATLPLSIGSIPVRTFFVVMAALLILSSLFLGWIMTTRISRPIEELERGARELIRGDFDVHISTEERGQIGRLTRTFNQMSDELRGRIEDLHVLNRGIRDLTSRLQPGEVLAHAVAFYNRNTPADHVRVLLRDRVREVAEIHGGKEVEVVDIEDATVREVLASSGPFSMRLTDALGAGFLAVMPAARAAVVLPLVVSGRNHGAVLLLFQTAEPPALDLELHATMAVQITAALENAWLYRTAVEDLHTGAFRPEYFANRVARAVREAQGRGGTVGLVGLRLTDGVASAEGLGQERHGRFLGRVCAIVRRVFGPDAELCRVADDELRVMVEDPEREELEQRLHEIDDQVRATEFELPESVSTVRLSSGYASYPDDAASSEFLADVLESRLLRGMPTVVGESRRLRRTPLGGKFVESPAMNAVFRTIERFAPTDISLLLEGETGVGKEMLTDLIHAWSKRASQPLVKVHCAALPEGLLQSELFGHEKGAFTGAHERNIGRFEQADGGTIFLDEIGEISLEVQVQLLRVLQQREIERVGGGRPIPVDVRVIAATNRNLREMVAAGTFREDLYYRLQGMVIRVPPLRERRSEIPELVEYFRAESVAAGQTSVRGFAPDAMDELFRRPWPGNIRELRNTVLRAMVLADGEFVTRADLGSAGGDVVVEIAASLPAVVPAGRTPRTPTSASEAPPVVIPAADPDAVEARLAKLLAWIEAHGEVSSKEVADAIGISPRTALRDLNRLQAEGRLERVGKRRGARYRLANSAADE
ncbi:MAG: sigma 54-interacting transcriptional regulator, partial [Planctomycetes bacterium]|nr:sigma 54-interacting transcriptional regulator [Planctomycetota bacterium]